MGSLDFYPNSESECPFPDPLHPEKFRRQAHIVLDFLADYYKNVANYPVLSLVEPGYLRKCLPPTSPLNPESIETILQDVQQHIIPGLTHWQSPNYYAYFPSSGSIAGLLGEMLSTGFNVVGFNWLSSPAATELQSIVMDWLAQLLNLPGTFLTSGNGGGMLLGTTCEALLCTLVVATDQMLRQIGRQNIGKLVVYASDQTHCAVQKAAQIAGILSEYFRTIKTTKSTSFTFQLDSLLPTIQSEVENGLVPCYLCAAVGTTATTSIDPIGPLCNIAKDYGFWVHVDAGYAGSSCICPEFRNFIDGVEEANSFSFNAHKWFLTNLDCCCLVKDPTSLTKSSSTDAEYLKDKVSGSKGMVDYKDWQITLSRKFRAMKLWLVLQSYGVTHLRNFLRNHVKMAKTFEDMVKLDKIFEIFVRRNFAMVCFRISPSAIANKIEISEELSKDFANGVKRKLLDSINACGSLYMIHTTMEGVFLIRCAIDATLTEERHVINAWKVVKERANAILNALQTR